MEPVLEINGLSVEIDSGAERSLVLEEIDLRVFPGEIVYLTGPSGVGKSTLASLVAGVQPEGLCQVVSGQMFLRDRGRKIDLLSRQGYGNDEVGTVGWVFQEPGLALNPVRLIGDQLLEACHTTEDIVFLKLLLRQLGLPEEVSFQKYPWQFSGGQQQRLLLAMALASRPILLVADEPTASLDEENRSLVLDALDQFRKLPHKPAVLFITHDLDLMHSLEGRRVALEEGSLYEVADCKRIDQRKPLPFRGDDAAMEACGPSLLMVHGLAGGYVQGKAVLDALDLQVEVGEVLGITGASGCGKSTLLRAIMGLLPWQIGSWAWKGAELEPEFLRDRGAMIYQDPGRSLNPVQSVAAAFSEVMRGQVGDSRARMIESLQEVGLTPAILSRKPHQLSGGQKQRVAIARALFNEPSFLLCDEPFSSLDPDLVDEFLELALNRSRTADTAVVLVAHDLGRLKSVCNRILFMENGHFVLR